MTTQEWKNRITKTNLVNKDYRLLSLLQGKELISRTDKREITPEMLDLITSELEKEIDSSIKNVQVFSTKEEYENTDIETPYLIYIDNTGEFIYNDGSLPNNVIRYTASQKLEEVNSGSFNNGGVDTRMFDVSIYQFWYNFLVSWCCSFLQMRRIWEPSACVVAKMQVSPPSASFRRCRRVGALRGKLRVVMLAWVMPCRAVFRSRLFIDETAVI